MKTTKKFVLSILVPVALVMVLIAALSLSGSGLAPNSEEAKLSKNGQSVMLFRKLAEAFPEIQELEAEENISAQALNGDPQPSRDNVYPSDYAGAFIDKNDVLHVVLVGEDNIALYRDALGNNDVYIIEQAETTLNDLLAIQSLLDSVMIEFEIGMTATDEEANCLKIGLMNPNRESDVLNYLEENIDGFIPSSVMFKKSSGISLTQASNGPKEAIAGSTLAVPDNSDIGFYTAGFNATRGGVVGVVTAGHKVVANSTEFKNSSLATIGKATIVAFKGKVDASFIPLPSTLTKSYKFMNNSVCKFEDNITDYYANEKFIPAIQGMLVYKFGAKTKNTRGTLDNLNATGDFGGVVLSDQFIIGGDIKQEGGDSGCPVIDFLIKKPKTVTPHNIMGIATGVDDNDGTVYCSKIGNIMSTLGLTVYTGASTSCNCSECNPPETTTKSSGC